MKNSILLIVLMLFGFESVAQVGYQGKRHEFSIDPLGIALNSKLSVRYKYILKDHCALIGGVQSKSLNRSTHFTINDSYGDDDPGLFLTDYTKKTTGYTLGVIYGNSGLTSMPLPVSYYIGFLYEKNHGTLSNRLSGYQYSTNKNEVVNSEFEIKERKFSFISGKGIYAGKAIVIDLMMGISFTSFKIDVDYDERAYLVREYWVSDIGLPILNYNDLPVIIEPIFEARIGYLF